MAIIDVSSLVEVRLFYGKTAESNFIKDVDSKVERVKQHDETKLEYMTLMRELKQQRREGQEE